MIFNFGVNRGVAYADGRIFATALDGRLTALDAKTGTPIWTAQTVSLATGQTVTGAPRVFDGKVIIGQGGADFGQRGYVTAYDAATGKQLWRFYVVPARLQRMPAIRPWKWRQKPGARISGRTRAAAAAHGTASPTMPSCTASISAPPTPARMTPQSQPRRRHNLFTASIVALDADTGKYIWHYQVVPRDEWDYDCTQQMTLADLTIDGKPRKVLMQAPKDGFFYVLDRETGKVISAEKIGKVTWAAGRSDDGPAGRGAERPL